MAGTTSILELGNNEFNWFRNFIESKTGIHILDTKHTFLYNRLLKRIRALGLESFGDYKAFLQGKDDSAGEQQRLFEAIVIPESAFFRYMPQMEYFRTHIFPELVKRRIDEGHPINIACLGCARGQEPYSLAILISEELPVNQRQMVRIKAVDLSEELVRKASGGVYSSSDIEGVGTYFLNRYFLQEENEYRLISRITRMIDFFRFNLVEDDWNMFRHSDLIMCRNTIIYFNSYSKEKVFSNMSRVLRQDGYMVLGHSEMLDASRYGVTHLGNSVYRKDK